MIACEACSGPDGRPTELSVTVAVKLYELGSGLGAVPEREMLGPVLPLG